MSWGSRGADSTEYLDAGASSFVFGETAPFHLEAAVLP